MTENNEFGKNLKKALSVTIKVATTTLSTQLLLLLLFSIKFA